jgi:small subunit ribosomal protein S17
MLDQPQNEGSKKRHGFRRKLVGTVKSDKMDKTIVVEVVRNFLHAKYKKYIQERKRFKAHDEKNECHIGDRVEIQEHSPISKHKRWVVTRIIATSTERLIEGLELPDEGVFK